MSTDSPDDSHEEEFIAARPRTKRKHFRERRDTHVDDYDEYAFDSRQLAQSKVQAPAIMLMVGGILIVACAILFVLGGFYLTRIARNNPEQIVGFVYLGIGVIGIPFGSLMTYGAFRMRRLQSHQLAMTSAILSMASIFCLGIFAVFVMPIGIWALVVLLDPDVKREFRRAQREGPDDAER